MDIALENLNPKAVFKRDAPFIYLHDTLQQFSCGDRMASWDDVLAFRHLVEGAFSHPHNSRYCSFHFVRTCRFVLGFKPVMSCDRVLSPADTMSQHVQQFLDLCYRDYARASGEEPLRDEFGAMRYPCVRVPLAVIAAEVVKRAPAWKGVSVLMHCTFV